MWTVMMVAMMLPSLVPTLSRYRGALGGSGEARRGMLTALVALGYFAVWSALGVVVYPLGVALAAIEIRLPVLARGVPVSIGVVVMLAGAMQFTSWKAQHLAWDHDTRGHGRAMSADAGAAWRHGLCLGVHCCYCCAGLTASFLALGVMDLLAMSVVTVAITAERLAPAGGRAARAVGVAGVTAGALLMARAVGLG
jgi:predicted metal-binding membrane protein